MSPKEQKITPGRVAIASALSITSRVRTVVGPPAVGDPARHPQSRFDRRLLDLPRS
jgi:hypothetical protein